MDQIEMVASWIAGDRKQETSMSVSRKVQICRETGDSEVVEHAVCLSGHLSGLVVLARLLSKDHSGIEKGFFKGCQKWEDAAITTPIGYPPA